MQQDVCLVQVPYAAIERPSIALGILNAALAAAGVRSGILYANLELAERVGADLYHAISTTPNEELLGEWTFAGAAFPEFEPDHEEYLGLAIASLERLGYAALLGGGRPEGLRELLWGVRRLAPRYVSDLAERVLERRPRIVGCSSTFQQHVASLALLRRIKQLEPSVITVVGGANCDGPMGAALRRAFEWVDVVVSGEADELIVPLCRRLLADGLDADFALAGVHGPLRNGRAAAGPGPVENRASLAILDRSPIPEYASYFEALSARSFARFVEPGLLLETSRGCWWGEKHHCTFCGLNGEGMAYRAKSPDRVVLELRTQAERFGTRRFEAVDNILSVGYLGSVMPVLAQAPERYELFYEIKANVKRRQLEAMADAGVRWVQPGIESFHDEVLRLIDKGCTALGNVQYLRDARELGIRSMWILLYDVPGERDEWYTTMARLVPLLEHLQPPDGVTAVQYHRFSPYHYRPEEYGLELRPSRGYDFVYPLAPGALDQLAYFFEERRAAPEGGACGAGRRTLGTRSYARRERPGLHALASAVGQWRAIWWGGAINFWPILSAAPEGDALVFRDTRRCARRRSLRLVDLERAVYLACGEQRPLEGVERALAAQGLAPAPRADIEAALARLVELRLVLELNGRYLALALNAPIREFAGPPPIGRFDAERYRAERTEPAGSSAH